MSPPGPVGVCGGHVVKSKQTKKSVFPFEFCCEPKVVLKTAVFTKAAVPGAHAHSTDCSLSKWAVQRFMLSFLFRVLTRGRQPRTPTRDRVCLAPEEPSPRRLCRAPWSTRAGTPSPPRRGQRSASQAGVLLSRRVPPGRPWPRAPGVGLASPRAPLSPQSPLHSNRLSGRPQAARQPRGFGRLRRAAYGSIKRMGPVGRHRAP